MSKVKSIADRLKYSIESAIDFTTRIEQLMEEVRKPVIHQREIMFEVVSKEIVFTFIGMLIIIAGLTP